MEKTILNTVNAPEAIGPYSQGIEVGGWIFTSGQLPIDPETGIMYKNCTIEKNGKSYTFDEDGVYTTVSAANKKK